MGYQIFCHKKVRNVHHEKTLEIAKTRTEFMDQEHVKYELEKDPLAFKFFNDTVKKKISKGRRH